MRDDLPPRPTASAIHLWEAQGAPHAEHVVGTPGPSPTRGFHASGVSIDRERMRSFLGRAQFQDVATHVAMPMASGRPPNRIADLALGHPAGGPASPIAMQVAYTRAFRDRSAAP